MRRKTKIVLAITTMATALVALFSYIYISQLLRQRITTAHETAARLTSQLAYLATNAAPDLSSTKVDTTNPVAVRKGLAYYLSTDRDLNMLLESVVGNWPMIYDAAIVDAKGKAILHTTPDLVGKDVPERADFDRVHAAKFRDQMRIIYSPATVYDVQMPLQLNGAPFGSIRVGVSTVFLKSEITPRLQHAAIFSGAAILVCLFLAAGLSHIALGPLENISRSLDIVTSGEPEPVSEDDPDSRDEYGLVTLKIAHLGRQMRDAKEIFSALKDNVDQIMANLQDGLMLFTRDTRVVLVSALVERYLGRPRRDLLGKTAREIFSADTALGAMLLEAFQFRKAIAQREIESTTGKRIQVSLDFIQEGGAQIGALLTLRDTESVRRIEDEIEMSRRLSASGRLTRGVAHEVKNPINAIVLHLQLLQNKLKADPDTRRHMDIIDSEIHRLDRVVQTLVDFMKTRELHTEEVDFRKLLEDVALLASPSAAQQGVAIKRNFSDVPLGVKVDTDLLKQAVLNIVLNGVQAMPEGGDLTISAQRQGDMIVTEIRDQGTGIPPELQDKVFELYFTTKDDGSGIGLAETYKIMQWHYGTVEFESAGVGTTFRLKLPRGEKQQLAVSSQHSALSIQPG
ncbi:MAG TPA: ATP-binding protein [Terriglobales bacterium]|nr:ATP-binding protein [Terriglobales bacterium]